MLMAVIIAVIAAVVVLLELWTRTDPRTAFIFVLLDLLVGDEPPVECPTDIGTARADHYSQRAA